MTRPETPPAYQDPGGFSLAQARQGQWESLVGGGDHWADRSVRVGSLTHTAFFSPRSSTPQSVAIDSTSCSPPLVLSDARSVAIFRAPAPSSTSIRTTPGSMKTETRNGVCACLTALVASSEVARRAESVRMPWASRYSVTKSRAAPTEAGSSGNSFVAPLSFVVVYYP